MAGLVLGAGLASSPGTAGSSSATCTFGGIRYVGKTSQKRDLCLTLSSKGKIVREYTYDDVDTCGTGTTRALNPRIGVMPVTPTGAFVRITPDGFFKGVVRAGKATGTFRQHGEATIPGKGSVTCDTHIVHWTAHRVG